MGAIKCYGDFWRRSEVDWAPGAGGKRQLLGQRKGTQASVINFRRQSGIYVLFNDQRQIVYLGQVGSGERARLYGRLRSHTINRLRERWTRFSWYGIQEVDEEAKEPKPFLPKELTAKQVLDELENILIHVLEPPLNYSGPKWGKEAIEYLQVPKKQLASAAKADDDDEDAYKF